MGKVYKVFNYFKGRTRHAVATVLLAVTLSRMAFLYEEQN